MSDFASDLKQRFGWAMDVCLESYEVLPDGRSFVRSDRDERAIELFENLRETVDAISPSLIEATENLRSAGPESFEKALARAIQAVGFGFLPTSATEFVEVLNRTAKQDSSVCPHRQEPWLSFPR
jgi:hypothetical protein